MESITGLNHKLNYLRRKLRTLKGVRLLADSPRTAFYQTLFSRGDRRVGEAMLNAYRQQKSWKTAFKQMQPAASFFVHRKRKLSEVFPWDQLTDPGLRHKLKQEYEQWLQIHPNYAE